MGRKNFRGGRKGGGGFNRGPRGGGNNGGERGAGYRSYPEIKKENEKLQRFYDGLLPLGEEERKKFWETLRKDLPNSFRFTGSKRHARTVRRLLETRYAPEIVKIERYDGQPVEAPQPVAWYPEQLAYSMNTPKQVIRKFPPFAAFQKFLVSETSVGNISRQELVSMIPPLLMDVEPGMTVLDLCAAPGSKAAQLLESVHAGEEARVRKVMGTFGEVKAELDDDKAASLDADSSDDGRATGLLIANDADYKRSHMLVHQLKRLSSPNLLVTNHDATLYPSIRLPRDPENPERVQYLRFDRILADVPCSGDGTLRKNLNLWKDWQPGNALGLHLTQTRILVRALQMLKPGGRVVYSTCSMNPVENEAVVVSAIERCGGPEKIDIIDCSDRLPGLKRYPGMFQWKIMDKSGRIWNNWEEVQQYALTKEDGLIPGKVAETMFPRPDTSDCAGLPLNRCMRVYAHQQDTGGFFITVLEKKAEFKAKPEAAAHPKPEVKATDSNTTQEAKEEVAAKLAIEEVKAAEGEPTDILPTNGVKRPREEFEEQQGAKKPKTEPALDHGAEVMSEVVPEPETKPAEVKTEDVSEDKVEDRTAVKAEDKTETADDKASKPNPQVPQRRRNPDGSYEEPFKYLPSDHEVIQNIQSFYKLSSRFPTDRYMVRNEAGEPAKAIYYTSELVRKILVENEGRGIKFVHGGVKMFMKQDAPSAEVCRWRIQSEGMPIVEGYVGEDRIVRLTKKETFHTLLSEMFPRFADGDWVKLGEIGERARDIGMGCCVLRIEPDGSDADWSERMALPLWKSYMSLNLMLPKEDRSALLLRLFNDTTPVLNQTLKDRAAKEAEKEAKAKEKGEEEDLKSEDVENAPSDVEEGGVALNGGDAKVAAESAENETPAA